MIYAFDPLQSLRMFYEVNSARLWFLLALLVCLIAAGEIAETLAQLPAHPGAFTV